MADEKTVLLLLGVAALGAIAIAASRKTTPSWPPPEGFNASNAPLLTPPLPLPNVQTKAVQDWYVLERNRLAVVYYGSEDMDPEVHRGWAESHDDLTLYNEIISMRRAFADGVVGSPDDPFAAYLQWQSAMT